MKYWERHLQRCLKWILVLIVLYAGWNLVERIRYYEPPQGFEEQWEFFIQNR